MLSVWSPFVVLERVRLSLLVLPPAFAEVGAECYFCFTLPGQARHCHSSIFIALLLYPGRGTKQEGVSLGLCWVSCGSKGINSWGAPRAQWQDSNLGDEAKGTARDLKHSAEQKGREIRDSWR